MDDIRADIKETIKENNSKDNKDNKDETTEFSFFEDAAPILIKLMIYFNLIKFNYRKYFCKLYYNVYEFVCSRAYFCNSCNCIVYY